MSFTRNFEVDLSQAIDFVGGTTYKLFMTYFTSTATSTSSSRCYGDFNLVDTVYRPIFLDATINAAPKTLLTAKNAPTLTESTRVGSGTFRAVASWGAITLGALVYAAADMY